MKNITISSTYNKYKTVKYFKMNLISYLVKQVSISMTKLQYAVPIEIGSAHFTIVLRMAGYKKSKKL